MSIQPSHHPDFIPAARRPTGVLLVHGLNGSRHDMEELTHLFRSHGMIAENMLLPGHGSHVREMFSLGWQEWAQAVRDELYLLKQQCDSVFLIGHSLGGALCLHVAAHEEVTGIVTMCAPLHMFPWTRPSVRFVKLFTPVLPTIREDVRSREARRRYARDAYRWTAMAPVESMLRFLPQLQSELPLITAPALIMTALHDHVVPVRDGREIYRHLGSREKHLVTLHNSYHVIMKDHDREEVFSKTLAFVHHHAPKTQSNTSSIDRTA